MATDDTVVMDQSELEAFIGDGGTGVLALAANGEPYATPVSYGYDASARVLYLRLGFGESSEKERFLDTPTPARLVIYDHVDDRWKSAIATGRLEPVATEDLSVDLVEALRRGDVPLVDIWGESPDDLEFELYRLRVDRLTGRKA